jgi:hypothetical protein
MRALNIFLLSCICLSSAERIPLTPDAHNSAAERWLNKKVLQSRLLDDMESLDGWSAFTNSAPLVVDARIASQVVEPSKVVAEMSLTSEHSRDGRHSLRLRNPTQLPKPSPANGRGWGESGILRKFDGEDWSAFNRISLWIYPDCPGHYVASLDMHLRNEGVEKLPAPFAQEGETSLMLKNHEWNHVVWEISNVARDKVTGLEIVYGMAGNELDGADVVTFDFDHMELELVEPDHIEGWDVWPGRISYSQSGYATGAPKSALASGLPASDFRLIEAKSGKTVLAKPIRTVKTRLGEFQVLDFSEARQAGAYFLEAGKLRTPPFAIGNDVWRESILKALNFFYAERCGFAVPGVHGVCHRDWQAVHGDKRIIINGGWHDAGDLSQGMGNTAEIVYALFSLAERLHERGEDPELYERLIEEGRWGLDWILKTSFGDGYRGSGSISSRHTNGILGDYDDVIATASNSPMTNLLAAASEALAARVLKQRDPRLAAYSLRMAELDWRYALEGLDQTGARPSKEFFSGSFDSAGVVHELLSIAVLAGVDLYRATGERAYADKAVSMARIILDSQERRIPNWTVPLTGYFYTSPAKDRILHYCHRGREQAPIEALTALCNALPDHPDWMKWYSAVALHAEYQKTIAKYTEPYGVMPASIYRDDDYLQVPESRRDSFRKQVLNGIPLGAGHYLRLFPVWLDYRGHFGTILPQAQALGDAAHLRGDLAAAQVAERQLEWVIGRNPFAQSTMYGEGYDFTPQYTPSSGDIVGSLPVGIQTRGDADAPYWPVQSTWTYKEVWVHPVARWIWLMKNLAGPALVEGEADAAVEFTDSFFGQKILVQPDPKAGRFRVLLPQGVYRVSSGVSEERRAFLPGASYQLDLRAGKALDLQLSETSSASGEVVLRVNARGQGAHRLVLRTDNLTVENGRRQLTLKPGMAQTFSWRARIVDKASPWVAVAVPDDDLSQRQELMGSPSPAGKS